MNTTLDDLQPDFRIRERTLIADAINNFGADDHPMADDATLPHFTVPYVLSCLTKCMRHYGHDADEFKTGLAAMDEINNRLAERRKEKSDVS